MEKKIYILMVFFHIFITCSYLHAVEITYFTINDIFIISDKKKYSISEKVKLSIVNKNKEKNFVFIGPCGLTLEQYVNGIWNKTNCPWSGCFFCNHQKEIPVPLFIVFDSSYEMYWDLYTSCCKNNEIHKKKVFGKFRFVLDFAEDKILCKSDKNPLSCWINFKNKKWEKAYSNEFDVCNEPFGEKFKN